MSIPVICLMGPTGSGKTQLAIELTQQLPCDIISVDSAMVYRGMDIGTAKPTPQQQALAPHRLIDICDPNEPFSAGQFRALALQEIAAISAADHIPLLVGGTMLYFRTLQHGLDPLPTANAAIRHQLAHDAEQQGWPALHTRLAQIDPQAAARIHPNDPQRIQRALEVYLLTGKSLTALCSLNSASPLAGRLFNLVVAPADRRQLHARLVQRWEQMLHQDFIAEVERLWQRGDLTPDLPALRAVGYRQAWDYLAGRLTYAQMTERTLIATRQLAKRQLTWLRTWPATTWFDSEGPQLLERIVQHLSF